MLVYSITAFFCCVVNGDGILAVVAVQDALSGVAHGLCAACTVLASRNSRNSRLPQIADDERWGLTALIGGN